MKKKPTRHDTAARPQPAQIDAIARLAETGQIATARERLARLRQQFPGFKPLLGLAYEVELRGGNQVLATLVAWDWAQASSNSVAAWEALRDSAGMAFSALCLFAMRHLDTLAGKPSSPPPKDEETPFGPLSFDAARRMDLCRLLLSASRFDEAAAAIAGIDHVSARNNLALVQFARGSIAEAMARLEENWHAVPENLFGLERLIRLRLWTGGLDQAAGLAAPLLATRPMRWDDQQAKLSGLLLLNRFTEADAFFVAADAIGLPHERSQLCYLGAYAAWRLGQADCASKRLRQAMELHEDNTAARDTWDALALGRLTGSSPDWLIGDFSAWWPMAQIGALRDTNGASEDEVLRQMDALAPHPDYLGRMVEQGGKGGRVLGVLLLKRRAAQGDAAAVAELRSLLGRPCGPDRQRSDIHGWLADEGILAKGEVSRVLLGGELKDVRAQSMRIIDAPMSEEDLPPDDAQAYARANELVWARKNDEAHAIMSRLYEKHPDHPRILATLATLSAALGHPPEQTEALARRALEIDPDYVFARTHLAKILAGRGETVAAVDLLKPIGEREELHVSEWRAYTLAQIDIAKVKDDMPGVIQLMKALDDIDERFGR